MSSRKNQVLVFGWPVSEVRDTPELHINAFNCNGLTVGIDLSIDDAKELILKIKLALELASGVNHG